jgi:hypothetical protein
MSTSRREFLAASFASFAAAPLFGAKPTTPATAPTTLPTTRPVLPADSLFLTWQRDPTTTMTIQWIGPEKPPADCAIAFTPDPAAPWQTQSPLVRPYPKTDLKVFRTELAGLKPDTMYQFRIGPGSQTHRFRTMPAKATNAIHFISGGDCGTNIHALNNNTQAARQDPAFALVGGDLGYDNGKSVNTSLDFICNYSKSMIARDGRLIPLLACLGNHEVDGGYGKPREKAPFFYALFDGLFSQTSYGCLDFGNYLSLVLLDTGHNSPIGGEQAHWLEQTLKQRVDNPNVFAVNHVPAYPSFRKMTSAATQPSKDGKGGTGVDNRHYWVPLFDKYRVPVVLEHHDHTFKRTKKLIDGMPNDNGVLYLGDGSWGKLRSPQSPDKLHYLASASHDYHLSLHCIEGEERFHLALDEFGRVMDVGHSGQRKRGLVAMQG